MNPNWWIAIVGWCLIFGVMVTLSIYERRLTPEQKQTRQEKAQARFAAYRKERKKPQEAPSEGCLITSLRTAAFGVMAVIGLLLALLILLAE